MKIFLTNLGKYNEGELIGEWVELPASQEELKKVFERIGTMKNTKNTSLRIMSATYTKSESMRISTN